MRAVLSSGRSRWTALAAGGLLLGSGAVAMSSCTGESTEAEVRSLERTGQVAFVCMGKPGSDAALRSLADCTAAPRQLDPTNFGTDESALHLYALVTLETRGELAVVDITAKEGNVLDQDPSTPGDNPLPVGAQPVDVVATPKGTAVFVASADTSRPGIYAIDAELLRPCEVDTDRCGTPPPTLSSYPACQLPSQPGAMVLVADPADAEGRVRQTCGGAYDEVEADSPTFGNIDSEGLGRQKLFVTLPKEGRVVVIDAQQLFSQDPGAFDACEIEAELPLSTTVPDAPPPPVIEPQPDCAVPEEPELRPSGEFDRSIPAGVALVAPPDGGTPGASGASLYVSDIGVPVIHVLDLADPCTPIEGEPLLPTSAEDPSRVVITDRVAVSRLTPSAHRYLYAIDVEDRSVMAFDISTDGSQQPLLMQNPEDNPFQPPDRVKFAAAPVDLAIIQRDLPEENDTGVSEIGTLCNPDFCCDTEECQLGNAFRTSSDFETGAAPFTLRGVFAVVALASGQVAVIDIEDFDAPCRGPQFPAAIGCGEDSTCTEDGQLTGFATSGELTCNVVAPHQTRSGFFLLDNEDVGRHLPGIQTFPSLAREDGTVVTDGPVMLAPADAAGAILAVAGELQTIPPSGAILGDDGPENTLVLTTANPRVHQADQEWALTYQGALPGFGGKVGDLDVGAGEFSDSTAGFCDNGVQPEAAVRARLELEGGLSEDEIDSEAARLADRLHVSKPLAGVEAPYWESAACTFADCRATFGDETVPTVSRDLRIIEARQDSLELAPPVGTDAEFMQCCFPTLVNYEVRAGDEWVLIGGASGFVHDVIADPVTGVCRPSCDTRLDGLNARAEYSVLEGEPAVEPVFENALFGFRIVVPRNNEGQLDLERDMAFRFITQASFVPLRVPLTSDSRNNVQIQSLGYVPMTDEFFATDGGLEGLLLVPGDLVGDIRQFF
ncbi:MAG: hypothetical protein HOW73_33160 [Polyangiaceae bacterium]|nr:hypothetical protein [Polyangiaceae bacterium]